MQWLTKGRSMKNLTKLLSNISLIFMLGSSAAYAVALNPKDIPMSKIKLLMGSEPISNFNGTVNVTSTIVINKPGVYDFKNVLHIWKGQNWGCSAVENGPQMLRIEVSNVVVKNFAFVADGKSFGSVGIGDPIHVATCGRGQGNLCTGIITNVVLDGINGHACEDLLTMGTPGVNNVTVQNSILRANPNQKIWDKTIQTNFGKHINYVNNRFIGGARCIRLKPNTDAYIAGNQFFNCQYPVEATSNDKDISPMTNGPVTFQMKGNKFSGTNFQAFCNDTSNQINGDGKFTCK